MKIIIAGSRDFFDYGLLKKKCDSLLKGESNIEIVSGGATGADQLGERYAAEKDYKLQRFPADWKTYGRAAGHIRNKKMADYAESLILFWDGKSPGSGSMLKAAKKKKLKINIVKFSL